MQIADEIISLGMSALHPIDPTAMNIFDFKKKYGKKVCLVGNLNVDLLARENCKEEIVREMTRLIKEIGIDGGYMFSSGNSISSYCRVENVLLCSDFLDTYGSYPIKL
ncbi:MAG: uroporphyrinogen decarboxylase family protein [Candidatus Humimicrobiaceae bacterium]